MVYAVAKRRLFLHRFLSIVVVCLNGKAFLPMMLEISYNNIMCKSE